MNTGCTDNVWHHLFKKVQSPISFKVVILPTIYSVLEEEKRVLSRFTKKKNN